MTQVCPTQVHEDTPGCRERKKSLLHAGCILIFKRLSAPNNKDPHSASSRDGQIFRTVRDAEWDILDEKKLKPVTILYGEEKDDQLRIEDYNKGWSDTCTWCSGHQKLPAFNVCGRRGNGETFSPLVTGISWHRVLLQTASS